MPRSAVAAGCIDLVLPAGEIAREIGRISAIRTSSAWPRRSTCRMRSPASAEYLALLRHATGVDFAHYKSNTLQRRITRRMLLQRLDALPDYVRMLESDSAELDALYSDILISVTSFFRNPESYEALKEQGVPGAGRGPIPPRAGARVGARLLDRRRSVLARDGVHRVRRGAPASASRCRSSRPT